MDEIADTPTQRVRLSDLSVRRLFAEAEVAEALRQFDREQWRPHAELRRLATQIALWTV